MKMEPKWMKQILWRLNGAREKDQCDALNRICLHGRTKLRNFIAKILNASRAAPAATLKWNSPFIITAHGRNVGYAKNRQPLFSEMNKINRKNEKEFRFINQNMENQGSNCIWIFLAFHRSKIPQKTEGKFISPIWSAVSQHIHSATMHALARSTNALLVAFFSLYFLQNRLIYHSCHIKPYCQL